MKTISQLIKELVNFNFSNGSKYVLEYSPEYKGKIRIGKTSESLLNYQWKPEEGEEVNVLLNIDRKFKIEISKVGFGSPQTAYVARIIFYIGGKAKIRNTLKFWVAERSSGQIFLEGLCKNTDKISKTKFPLVNNVIGIEAKFEKGKSSTVKFYTYLSSDIDVIIESIEEVLGEYGESILKMV